MIVDIFLVYHFLKRLVTPFKEWDAYKLGIIDQDGKVLKKRRELKTAEEKKSWQHFDVMIANLKKLLGKIPGGKSRIASWAAALLLLKEHQNNQQGILTEEIDQQSLEHQLYDLIEQLEKEEIANVGANVAGIGQGPQGEPGLTAKQMKKYKKKNKEMAPRGLSFAEHTAHVIDQKCECNDLYEDLVVEEAEYEGRKVKLNDPIRTSEDPNKKFKVYVRNDKGNVVVVRFGDPNLSIKRDDPDRRRSFRARHKCDNPGPKWKPRYWSCYQWRPGAKVDN